METGNIISLVADLLTLIGFAIAIIGIFLMRRQIRQGYVIQRATFFKELYQMMYGDAHIREAFYLIDYEKFAYNKDFAGSSSEQLVDHLLNFFDLLCGLYFDGMLGKQEMKAFEYEFEDSTYQSCCTSLLTGFKRYL